MFAGRRVGFGVALAASLGALLLTAPPPAMAATEIPWKADVSGKPEVFERTSFEEDVKDVLRGILRQNDVGIIFRPGVEGKITFQFRDMPLQAAFNKLITEHDLDFEFDPAARLVTVFRRADRALARELVELTDAAPDVVRDAVRRFGLAGKATVDEATRMVLLEGTQDQVRALKQLVEQLDQGARGRREQALRAREASAQSKTAAARAKEAELRDRQAEAEQQRAEVQRKLLEQCLKREIRVIPLRFATVGETTRTFAGRSVTLPGIEESLNRLLGLAEEKKAEQRFSQEQKQMLQEIRTGEYLTGVPVAPMALGTQAEAGLGLGLGAPPFAPPARPAPVAGVTSPASLCGLAVSVDARSNSVIARGTLEELGRVEKAVKSLDKPVPMIEIEVMIVQASKNFSRTLGIGWGGEKVPALLPNVPPPGTVRQTGEDIARITGIGSGNTGLTPVNPQGVTGGLTEALLTSAAPLLGSNNAVFGFVWRGSSVALQAQIRAAESDNDAQTLGAPIVVTLNNVTARVDRKATEYFQTAATTGAIGGAALNALTAIDVGLKLDILPSVIPREKESDEELVRLVVNARNTSVSAGGGGTGGKIATSGQEVQTDVVIPNGRTFIMAGLLDDTRADNQSGVPYLKDIPFLGQLFRLDSKTDNLEQTLFFITPKIIWPEQIMARDIAERRYLESRKFGLSELRKDIQDKSRLTAPLSSRRHQEEE